MFVVDEFAKAALSYIRPRVPKVVRLVVLPRAEDDAAVDPRPLRCSDRTAAFLIAPSPFFPYTRGKRFPMRRHSRTKE